MSPNKKSIFTADDGTNLMFTFILVTSLFLLWGICNGMIDVMDKHFQEELSLTKAQSAWVQFAHYLGYFLMSIPAGWLAVKLGYKGGIITGLLLVAAGGFWFIPATYFNSQVHLGRVSEGAAFVAYLGGVCAIASGLTFLETIANPYTTVLGGRQYAATRINLAQSCNGIGWIFGPVIGSIFFYSKDAAGHSTGSQTLYIPYVTIAIVVIVLAVIFYFANVPDIKTKDDYHLDEKDARNPAAGAEERQINRGLVYFLLLLNAAVLAGACGTIVWAILGALRVSPDLVSIILWTGGGLAIAVAAILLVPTARKITHHSIWSHPHFSSAVLAQFFYVAAQAGIFSFLINYMTAEVPPIPASWDAAMSSLATHAGPLHDWMLGWFELKNGVLAISDKGASNLAAVGFVFFLTGRFTGAALLRKFSAHKAVGFYALMNVLMTLLVFFKLGWLSVLCVFLSYFFMSIMFPTIFALGIFGLGARAKKASAYIVMAIMGGALLPKLMGYVADKYDMSRGFIVPTFCFAFVAFYGFMWPRFSKAESLHEVKTTGH